MYTIQTLNDQTLNDQKSVDYSTQSISVNERLLETLTLFRSCIQPFFSGNTEKPLIKRETDKINQSPAVFTMPSETNVFFLSNHMEPFPVRRLTKKILRTVKTVLFGKVNPFDREKIVKKKKSLRVNEKFWKERTLACHSIFTDTLSKAFQVAQCLLDDQWEYGEQVNCERMLLLGEALLMATGMIFKQFKVIYFSLIGSLFTMLFMFTHYGTTSFRQMRLATDLQCRINLLKEMSNPISP